MFEKLLMLNTLKNQHIIEPVDDENVVIKDAIGIQAQYINNALFAIAIRHTNMPVALNANIVRKVWSFRGTLHLHIADEASSIIGILRNEWYARWGKYMSSIFTGEARKEIQNQTCQLIESGFYNRQMLRDECLRLNFHPQTIEDAFSSWGGILKDLNYDGKIHFSEYDQLNFSLGTDFLSDNAEQIRVGTDIIKRYFSFYGPATLSDFCYWSGVSQSLGKQWLISAENHLSYETNEKGKKYYYIGKMDENLNGMPKCIFLGGFDPIMLAYKDKSRWLKPENHSSVFSKNGFVHNVILIDGMARANWKIEKDVLRVTIFEPIESNTRKTISDFVESSKFMNCNDIVYTRLKR